MSHSECQQNNYLFNKHAAETKRYAKRMKHLLTNNGLSQSQQRFFDEFLIRVANSFCVALLIPIMHSVGLSHENVMV